MGQAKLRGTPEQRKQAAIDKQLSLRPKHIICNHCQAELTEMDPIDVSELAGIDAAFVATCPHCSHDTYAIKGWLRPPSQPVRAYSYSVTVPRMQALTSPPTHTWPLSSRLRNTRPSRPSAWPWVAV